MYDAENGVVVKGWSPRHDLVCVLKASGFRNNEIAEKLGYEPAYVSVILSDPRAKEKVEEFRGRVLESMEDVGLKIKSLALKAVETAEYWMDQRHPRLAQASVKSAFGILDRAGYTKVEKHLIGHFEVTPEMERLARVSGQVREQFDYGNGGAESSTRDGDPTPSEHDGEGSAPPPEANGSG